MKRVFIGWWGSIENGGETIGDLFAVDAIISKLKKFDITVGSVINYDLIKKYSVNPLTVNHSEFDIFIFACGPLIGKSTKLKSFIDSFKSSIKIAVGVSILNNELMGFDFILPRDSNFKNNYFDIALSSPYVQKLQKQFHGSERKFIGFCLRGSQREYGEENCLDNEVEHLINVFLKTENSNLLFIETRLDRINFDYSSAYLNFLKCKFIITTRLHGTLLSINSGTPFVSIDQIRGGAKVYNLKEKLNCNLIYKVSELKTTDLLKLFEHKSKTDNSRNLLDLRNNALLKSERTLMKMCAIIKNI